MLKINKILCIGNNSIDTDVQCRHIATEYNIAYKGMASQQLENGCYHTAFEDVTYDAILDLSNQADKVILLEQPDQLINFKIFKNLSTTDVKFTPVDDSVLIVGCSHTAGTGHKTADTVYTSYLASKLNRKIVVDAVPGQGNFTIEDSLSKYSLKDAAVIVQFTDIFRIRYYDETTDRVITKPGGKFSLNEVEMFTEERLAYEFKQIVKRTVSRLRDANAKFLFFQLSTQYAQTDKLNLFMSQFKEYCWTPDIDIDRADDGIHYGSSSNLKLATRLANQWNHLYAAN